MLSGDQQSITWQDCLDYKIKDDQIHIWYINIDDYQNCTSELMHYLDDYETKRAQQFKFAKDRNSFICSHAILRWLLSEYCNCDQKKIIYNYNNYNKPALNKDHKIHFNLSHSFHRAVIAITRNTPIGIDVEFIQPKSILDNLAERFFSAQEYNEYKTLPQQQKTLGFYNCWTSKEAFVKTLGMGLAFPLKNFTVNLNPKIKAKILSIEHQQINTDTWQLHRFIAENQYCIAIAWQGPTKTICAYKTNTDFIIK
ncbi:MAG: 4'-phosphopantetheinyl transferase superfamily protein [Gammaproteobacteria bacterium]|jgi:4'-phosphopantetheinyl transferase